MLEALQLENIAVVKRLDVTFENGFTVLSGETGAGKSIIMDSLSLLSGGRADKELIRSGERKAQVSAVFSNHSPMVRQKLEELGLDGEEECLILSRTIADHSSSARLNGRPVTLGMMREVAELLFHIHGQHDNQKLLVSANHIALLDSYASCEALLSDYDEAYRKVLHLRSQLDCIRKDSMEQARLCEMLKFQIADIDGVKPKAGEDVSLETLAVKLRGAERIRKCCLLVEKALRGGDKSNGAVYLTDRSAQALTSVADALPGAEELAARLQQVRFELEDIADSAGDLADFGDGDPAVQLDRIENRLHALEQLKKKYGATVEDVIAFRADAAQRLDALEHAEERCEDLAEELKTAEMAAKKIASHLTEVRRKAADALTRQITQELTFLDMPKVRFSVSVQPARELLATGADKVEFLIATNPGEPLLPMAKIASGGELARIMLSIQTVLNECDGVDTVIFDEIDTGISGKTSRKVGIKLKQIGQSSQVLCVTHSAQIASLADCHVRISKVERDGRAESRLTVLSEEQRVEEIARILGGIEVTDLQRSAAREMIAEGKAL